MRFVVPPMLAALTASTVIAQPGIHPDEIALEPEIDAAIRKGVEALIDSQYRDGTWGQWGRYRGGKTALCTYALLKCGVAADHPTIRRALLFLDPIRPTETYTVGCMLLAYGAAGQMEYRDRMTRLTELLIDWQKGGDYAYPTGNRDLSNTQYAALGLWTAQKYGIEVPRRVWLELADAVLRYTSQVERVKAPTVGQGTVRNGGMMEIAGFGYRRGHKPTGSMTTAGVSTLQICKIGLGGKLQGRRRDIDRAIEAGVNWLAHNFTVDKNPGKGDWHYYYLYGLERVGALTRIEQMGEHWWYLAGARHLLARQQKDGHWPGGGQKRDVKTAFALLFLRRATAGKASTTGVASESGAPRHLFTAGTDKDDVAISAAGQQPLAVWVKGFGEALTKRHEQHGIRVVEVRYLDGDAVLGQLAGEPTKAWTSDAFMHRAPALQRGAHSIRARVELVAPEAPPGETSPTEVVTSPPMAVTVRDVFAPWMNEAARIAAANLVDPKKVEATASSNEKAAKRACDGDEATHWVCGAADPDPVLSIDLGRRVSAKQLTISQAGSRASDIGQFDRIRAVELRLNGSKPRRVELDRDPLAITTVPFGKSRSVRRIELRIVEREPGRKKGEAGFTEITLGR